MRSPWMAGTIIKGKKRTVDSKELSEPDACREGCRSIVSGRFFYNAMILKV